MTLEAQHTVSSSRYWGSWAYAGMLPADPTEAVPALQAQLQRRRSELAAVVGGPESILRRMLVDELDELLSRLSEAEQSPLRTAPQSPGSEVNP